MVEQIKEVASNVTKTRIRSILAILYTLWAGAYMWKYSFTMPESMNPDAKFIAGFVTGTLVAAIISFYFGGTEEPKKEETL
jgi:hypothetical protein